MDGLRFGLMTCYDLRFPEVGRLLADAGADVFLVPAEWVRGPLKEHHWRTLLHARAIENTVFVAAADHPPPLGVGNSMIVDPQGVEIAAIGTATDIAVAHLDVEAVARVRRVNPCARAATASGRAALSDQPRRHGEPGCRLFEHLDALARRESHERRVLAATGRARERGERDRDDARPGGERAAEVRGIRRSERVRHPPP